MKLLKNLKNSLIQNKWLLAGFLAIIFISYFYLSKVFALHFVDEEDNLVLGHFLLSGQKLYLDLFSHHQPLAYIFSAAFQWIISPDNIFMLIKRHREFMITWSVIWSGILIWKFKEKVIIPLIIYEVSKFYLLGQLFLSESLAVYPVLYLTLFLFNSKGKTKTSEFIISGFLISFSALLLAPIWPFLAAYSLLLVWLKKPSVKQLIFLSLTGLIPILISLPFIDLYYYFHNVFYINFKYYIPQSGEEGFLIALLKAFTSPLTVLLNETTIQSSSFILKIVLVFFAVSLAFLVKTRKFKMLITVLTLLTLANIRYVAPGLQYYSGFHLLIWYSLFILISFYFLGDFIQSLKSKNLRILIILLALVGMGFCIFSSKELFQKNDKDHNYYVNYSQQYAFGEAIKGMKDPGDTLFVVPDEWLLYFQADIKNNNKMVNFYGWMSLVWELNDIVTEKFKTDPPTFFYCDCDEKYVFSYAGDNYHQMIRDGSKTPLWILNDKFKNLTEDQKNKIRFFHFEVQ